MTEEEAKSKWCPQNGQLAPPGTRDGMCIGSACMAWRWMITAVEPQHSHMAVYPQPRTLYETSDTDGRCGLAGPQ